jgi:hypothetical protein
MINQKNSLFTASCKYLMILQESKTYKTAKIFQGLAVHGHELLLSLKTRAKFFGTQSTVRVTVSVTSDFNITYVIYLVVRGFYNRVFMIMRAVEA